MSRPLLCFLGYVMFCCYFGQSIGMLNIFQEFRHKFREESFYICLGSWYRYVQMYICTIFHSYCLLCEIAEFYNLSLQRYILAYLAGFLLKNSQTYKIFNQKHHLIK